MFARLSRLSPYPLWVLLSLPALQMAYAAATASSDRIYHILLHPSGEWSARLLIVSLMATPLMMLFKGWRGPRWLVRNRRYLGVAAFGYAAVHTGLYLGSNSLDRVLSQATEFDIWTGWLAFAVFIPLAATSMDWAVRRMGTAWKSLQRWVYGAAVLTLLHWASLHDWAHPAGAILQFAPLGLLTLYRLWYNFGRTRPARLA